MSKIEIDLQEIKADLNLFFQASMSALCHCYDHTDGFYPDSCSCEESDKIKESVDLLIDEHRRLIEKYNGIYSRRV